ncbi:MAG: alpha/beta hydrolase family esterase [Candidatus Dormibacteria bacterium]
MDTSEEPHLQGATSEDDARVRSASKVLQVRQGALDRSARIYRAAKRARQPGLVILLHGAVGSGEEMARLTNFDAQVDRLGWIAVYPDAHNPGPNGGWDAHACCAQSGVNDVDFVRQLIDATTRSDAVDPSRVYVAGFSRGGMMAYRLGCELADRVAAIAVVAGNMSDRNGNIDAVRCRPTAPVSLLAIHGTDDRNVPIEGGAGPDELAYFKERPELRVFEDDLITYAALSDVVAFWRRADHCSDIEEIESSPSAATRRWRGPGGVCVEVLQIEGGTHAWPGFAHPTGTPDASVEASEIVADFFVRHPRSKRVT